MSVTLEEARRIASLARLRFSDEELLSLTDDLSRILRYVEQLQDLDLDDVPPLAHTAEVAGVTRPDTPLVRITRDEALEAAAESDDAFFRVPKVIE